MFNLKNTEVGLICSKTGLFMATESGGGRTNTGNAEIWCSPDGKPLRAIYIPKRGELACGTHAMVNVSTEQGELGCFQIIADHHRGDFQITVRQVRRLLQRCMPARDVAPDVPSRPISPTLVTVMWAEMEDMYHFSEGEWYEDPPAYLCPAIEAAKAKALCYHCREPHYIQDPDNPPEPSEKDVCTDCPDADGVCFPGDQACREKRGEA